MSSVETWSEAHASRRALLGGICGIALTQLLRGEPRPSVYSPRIVNLESEQPGPTVTLDRSDFDLPGDRLPQRVLSTLEGTLAELNGLLTPEKRETINNLRLYQLSRFNLTHTPPLLLNVMLPRRGRGGVLFGMHPGVAYRTAKLNRSLFHEGMHLLTEQLRPDQTNLYSDGVLDRTYEYIARHPAGLRARKTQKPPLYETIESGSRIDLTRNGLFPVFDESSYQAFDPGGHPYDGADELAASSLTIMHFFPRSLIATVETLVPGTKIL